MTNAVSNSPEPDNRDEALRQASKPSEFGNGSGAMRAVRAAQCSVKGLKAAFVDESAFRQELFLACLFVPLAFYLGRDLPEKLLLICLVVLVLIVELLNSAIEATVDRIGLESHPLSAKAKDLGSAAVFISLLLAGGGFASFAYYRFI